MLAKIDIPSAKLNKLYWNKKLSITDIAAKLGYNRKTIYTHMLQQHIQRRSYSEALRFPIRIPSDKNLSYLAGVLAGDGNINSNGTFELQTIDHDFALNTFKQLEKIAPAKLVALKRKTSAGKTVFSVRLHRKAFNDILQKINFTDATRKNMFINGILDSEACINNSNRTISIYMDNGKLLSQIQSYFMSRKIHSRLYCRNGKHYSLTIIRKYSIIKFHKIFRITIIRKQNKLNEIILSYRR